MRISPDVNQNIDVFQKRLHCDLNFDIVFRAITICGRTAAMFFVDGFAKDEIIEKLMEFFYSNVKPEQLADAHTFSKACVPYCEVTLREEEEEIATGILSGELALFVTGSTGAYPLIPAPIPSGGMPSRRRTVPSGAPRTLLWRPSS